MGIRVIRKAGKTVAYQAIGGAGARGASAYFSIARYGDKAHALASQRAAELEVTRPRRVYKARGRNAQGIPGLRLEYRATSVDAVPVVYAIATWQTKNGQARTSSASTQKHGLLGAVARVRQKREAGTGQTLDLTDRQVLNRMQKALVAP